MVGVDPLVSTLSFHSEWLDAKPLRQMLLEDPVWDSAANKNMDYGLSVPANTYQEYSLTNPDPLIWICIYIAE